ncbi:MAG: UDP-2,3-diacylglucosamine diphosphatase LpxI [Candidatus Omnitrophica bacterium]|nr:UDP-2,3-diacylglucosamine diphosphatase LpxI [Candidatus Omnitrophota bacterium]
MTNLRQIAIIAGSGKFPLLVAKAAKSNNLKVITLSIISSADKKMEVVGDKNYWIELGQGKQLLDIMKKEGVTHAVMAGKINKSTIIRQSVRLDQEAKNILSRVRDKKDDTILSAVAGRLRDFNIELLDSTLFLKGFMSERGTMTRKPLSKIHLQDIRFGLSIAKNMGSLDIGQSVIIKDRAVIAVEAIEGTDEAIKRAGQLVGEGCVVVKVSKPAQDMRFDVPVVGLETIKAMKFSGASVLALEAGKVLMLEKSDMIQEAEKIGLSIVGV